VRNYALAPSVRISGYLPNVVDATVGEHYSRYTSLSDDGQGVKVHAERTRNFATGVEL